jgi:hypothetical protein
MIRILHNLAALFRVKKRQFFAEFFSKNIFKIITSVPVQEKEFCFENRKFLSRKSGYCSPRCRQIRENPAIRASPATGQSRTIPDSTRSAEIRRSTWDGCYDLKKCFFAKKMHKIGFFDSKQS